MFADCSSLQGIRYIVNQETTLYEKWFWSLVITVAFLISIYFIYIAFDNWINSPIIISLNPNYKSVLDIPMAAITICNMNEISKERGQDIMNGNNEKFKLYLDNLCKLRQKKTKTFYKYNYDNYNKFIKTVSQSCDELIMECFWSSVQVNCSSIFTTVITDEGLCCTFNEVTNIFNNIGPLVNDNYWTPELGYSNDDNMTIRNPRRTVATGRNFGLQLFLNISINNSYCSTKNAVGLKIMLHNPHERPLIQDYGFVLEPGLVHLINIEPKIYEAEVSLKKTKLHKRHCVFENEHRLSLFTYYSQFNCIVESMAYTLANMCNCTLNYFPKISNVALCDTNGHICKEKYFNEIIKYGKSNYCLPSCNEIIYEYIETASDISDVYLRSKINYTNNYTLINSNYMEVEFFFRDSKFTTYLKQELIGFTDFLATVGGLLGLFLGFSVVTIVEVIYFPLSSLYCWYRRKMALRNNLVLPFNK